MGSRFAVIRVTSLFQQEWMSLAPSGVSVNYYDECSSTNSLAVEKGAQGFQQPTWFVAGKQTAGRGRRGRTWTSQSGNLYGSLLTCIEGQLNDLATLPYVVALAVRDTFLALGCDPSKVRCKWPNDVLIDEKKASGILIESSADGSQNIDFVVVGVGLNLKHSPESAQFPSTCVTDHTGVDVSPSQAFRHLSHALHERLSSWQPNNVADVVREWSDVSWGLGKRREIRTNDETFTATLIGLDKDGGLRLHLDDGTMRTLYAGDVFAGPSPH